MSQRRSLVVIVASQAALFLAVIFIPYDPLPRRLALALTNFVVTGGIIMVDRNIRRHGGQLPLWAMLIGVAAVWLDALANFWLLYTYVWWWDRFTHAFGGFALGIMAAQIFWPRLKSGVSAAWMGLWVGQTLGAWYEISEYLGDMWFKTWRVMSIYDSPRDLWFNFLGGAAALGLLLLVARNREKKTAKVIIAGS